MTAVSGSICSRTPAPLHGGGLIDMVGRSHGAGVRETQLGGVEDFFNRVMKEAFALGAGPVDDPARESVGYLKLIYDWLSRFNLAELGRAIREGAMPAPPPGVSTAAAIGAGPAAGIWDLASRLIR